MRRLIISAFFLLLDFFPATALSQCVIRHSQHKPISALQDPFFHLLSSIPQCPRTVIELRKNLQTAGAHFITTMVANQGFHHPERGSFSFFEAVEIPESPKIPYPVGAHELLFGHFVSPGASHSLRLDQDPASMSLMVELLAWDPQKTMFNFYELIGTPQGAQWFYRGDSQDIWADTQLLHRKREPHAPIFGTRLRCSGCHLAGGPLMKELQAPHDSWWKSERPLPFAGRTPDPQMQEVMATLQPPAVLQDLVLKGLRQLFSGKAFIQRQEASLQVALRPLFCPEEINLAASLQPLLESQEVTVPTGFFLDDRLGSASTLVAKKSDYIDALTSLHSSFGEPPITRLDADHGWNTPIKGTADRLAIDALVQRGRISHQFVTDVLSVDWSHPVFSPMRCELLPLVPMTWSEGWQTKFRQTLQESHLPGASILLAHMERSQKPEPISPFLAKCADILQTPAGVQALVEYLGQVRKEVSHSEISQNSRGQILEPGFRMIFPLFTPEAMPGVLTLDENCWPR